VTVVTLAKGLAVRLAARPAAITTIIVSPMARLTASSTPPTTPGSAAGTSTCGSSRFGGRAHREAAVAHRLRHGGDAVIGHRGDEGDDHHAHHQPGGERAFGRGVGMPSITAKSRMPGAR
jgi:hypothetical protein